MGLEGGGDANCRRILAHCVAMPEPVQSPNPPAPTAEVRDEVGTGEGAAAAVATRPVREIGGPPGPEPTRYGDWEKAGRCIDF